MLKRERERNRVTTFLGDLMVIGSVYSVFDSFRTELGYTFRIDGPKSESGESEGRMEEGWIDGKKKLDGEKENGTRDEDGGEKRERDSEWEEKAMKGKRGTRLVFK